MKTKCGRRGYIVGSPLERVYRPRCYLSPQHRGNCKGYLLLQIPGGMQRETFVEWPNPRLIKHRESIAGANTICDDIPDSWVK